MRIFKAQLEFTLSLEFTFSIQLFYQHLKVFKFQHLKAFQDQNLKVFQIQNLKAFHNKHLKSLIKRNVTDSKKRKKTAAYAATVFWFSHLILLLSLKIQFINTFCDCILLIKSINNLCSPSYIFKLQTQPLFSRLSKMYFSDFIFQTLFPTCIYLHFIRI